MAKTEKAGIGLANGGLLKQYRVLTVDPGVRGTGVAFWLPGNLPGPYYTKAIRADNRLPWLARAEEIVRHYRAVLDTVHPQHVVIEDQEVWLNSAVGAAAANRGDLVKLAQLTGMLVLAARDFGRETALLPVRTWKGQLPKSAVNTRIRRELGEAYPDHVADAVGIGLHLQGLL